MLEERQSVPNSWKIVLCLMKDTQNHGRIYDDTFVKKKLKQERRDNKKRNCKVLMIYKTTDYYKTNDHTRKSNLLGRNSIQDCGNR